MKEFDVVNNMFKKNIKKRNKNKLMRYRRKKQTKKSMERAFMLKRIGCAQGRKNAKSKYTQNTQNYKYRIYRIWFWISEMWQKFIIVYLYHVGGVSSVSI